MKGNTTMVAVGGVFALSAVNLIDELSDPSTVLAGPEEDCAIFCSQYYGPACSVPWYGCIAACCYTECLGGPSGCEGDCREFAPSVIGGC